RRTAASMSRKAMSAVPSVTASGVLQTMTPRRSHSLRSMLSNPTAKLHTTFSCGPAASSASALIASWNMLTSASGRCSRRKSWSAAGSRKPCAGPTTRRASGMVISPGYGRVTHTVRMSSLLSQNRSVAGEQRVDGGGRRLFVRCVVAREGGERHAQLVSYDEARRVHLDADRVGERRAGAATASLAERVAIGVGALHEARFARVERVEGRE